MDKYCPGAKNSVSDLIKVNYLAQEQEQEPKPVWGAGVVMVFGVRVAGSVRRAR